jgi:hypothetical protein
MSATLKSNSNRSVRPAADAKAVPLEPTYSVAEVAAHFGMQRRAVDELVALGREYGEDLHPAKGGLWPTYKISHKCRRIPASAIRRHLEHMAALDGTRLPAA